MEILKFNKKKPGWYEILLFDNSKVVIHEDLILKYELLLSKNLSDDILNKINLENNIYLSYDKALKLICKKMRSIYEVKQYLKKHDFSNDMIENCVNKLVNQGYLNDLLYCKAFVNDRINLSNDGPKKIVEVLKQNNIKQEFIDEAMSVYSNELNRDRVEKLVNKQIGLNNNKGCRLLKQKILSYMINLGYDRQDVVDCLNNCNIDDEKIYEKEYKKLYEKLSKKYSGTQLDYLIKQKLFQKGFRI